jgi:hypothetical protein
LCNFLGIASAHVTPFRVARERAHAFFFFFFFFFLTIKKLAQLQQTTVAWLGKVGILPRVWQQRAEYASSKVSVTTHSLSSFNHYLPMLSTQCFMRLPGRLVAQLGAAWRVLGLVRFQS